LLFFKHNNWLKFFIVVVFIDVFSCLILISNNNFFGNSTDFADVIESVLAYGLSVFAVICLQVISGIANVIATYLYFVDLPTGRSKKAARTSLIVFILAIVLILINGDLTQYEVHITIKLLIKAILVVSLFVSHIFFMYSFSHHFTEPKSSLLWRVHGLICLGVFCLGLIMLFKSINLILPSALLLIAWRTTFIFIVSRPLAF
tara:strand:+ start:1150 stop:1758 length:609 start_codon:yes stop_codon:yes gene_type:complete